MVTAQMMDSHWTNDPVQGDGNVISQVCHSCDLLRCIAGVEPTSFYAAGNYYQTTNVVDNLCATFRFESGSAGSWVKGDCACPSLTGRLFLQVSAENRGITLDEHLTHLFYQESGKDLQDLTVAETGFVEESRAFVQADRSGRLAAIDHKDGPMATLIPLQAMTSLKSSMPKPALSHFQQSTGE